jgi:hypothetical protein
MWVDRTRLFLDLRLVQFFMTGRWMQNPERRGWLQGAREVAIEMLERSTDHVRLPFDSKVDRFLGAIVVRAGSEGLQENV